ncbi:hypothetical protein [Tianweitania sediminis]|uniref:Uncharacterized protein n=1 Tax=Tianweitania sediminis TaxID=1502156 RepID=A0A8J7UHU0_9HYPH|nr:hypothetical protein [Tianweitania sediminis]MBP0438168.1 hypothetical protein [Tianweitania sediminis]
MLPDTQRRPVSGEMMTPGRGRTSRTSLATMGVDALPLAPKPAHGGASAKTRGLGILERYPGSLQAARAGAMFWICGSALAFCAFWISGGHSILPEGSLTKSAGVTITNVETRVEESAGRAVLVVDGEARNNGAMDRAMPTILVAVTGQAGTVTRYQISGGGARVAADGTYLFSSRLRVSPEGVQSVAVTLKPAD